MILMQVNLVKQLLVDSKLRVELGSDYPSTMQMVSHVIESRWVVHSDYLSLPPTRHDLTHGQKPEGD